MSVLFPPIIVYIFSASEMKNTVSNTLISSNPLAAKYIGTNNKYPLKITSIPLTMPTMPTVHTHGIGMFRI